MPHVPVALAMNMRHSCMGVCLTSLCMQSVKWTDDTVEVNEFMGKKSSKSECAGMRSSRPVPLPISASSASF